MGVLGLSILGRGSDSLEPAESMRYPAGCMSVATAPHQQLEAVLQTARGEPLAILLTGHPDPDAIGSALAHQRICDSLGVPATICHVLPVSHRENRALCKLLGINMLQVTDEGGLAPFRYLSLVDSSSPEPSIVLPQHLEVLTIVDHHRGPMRMEPKFADVRGSIGASCSIYAEYLQNGLATLSGSGADDARVATALLFGIQTDTDDFALATQADFLAAAYVRPFCDAQVLRQVGRRTVGAATMTVLWRALSNLLVVRDFAIAGVGRVAPGDRDSIAAVADYIHRREDIDTVLVFGIVGDRIDGSLRTNSPSVDPALFLKTAFGTDRDGTPFGGGRADKGGFQIPLGFLAEVEDADALWRLVDTTVLARLQRVVPDLTTHAERRDDDARRR